MGEQQRSAGGRLPAPAREGVFGANRHTRPGRSAMAPTEDGQTRQHARAEQTRCLTPAGRLVKQFQEARVWVASVRETFVRRLRGKRLELLDALWHPAGSRC
jgi:hypothetical protein